VFVCCVLDFVFSISKTFEPQEYIQSTVVEKGLIIPRIVVCIFAIS